MKAFIIDYLKDCDIETYDPMEYLDEAWEAYVKEYDLTEPIRQAEDRLCSCRYPTVDWETGCPTGEFGNICDFIINAEDELYDTYCKFSNIFKSLTED